MINYSLVKRYSKVGDKTSPMMNYAKFQATKEMSLDEFAEHIASHGSVYSKGDIYAILTMAVDCLREQLLAGMRVCLGDLGLFYLSIQGKGAPEGTTYNPTALVKCLRVIWVPGDDFSNLVQDAEYKHVPTLKDRRKLLAAKKAGATTVDLTDPEKPATGGSATGGSSSGSDTGTGTGGSTPGDDNSGEDLNI
ncbi:MAG: DNA-binding protein [Bacteroidaceae bacterium]|nr:DNA-binding protein [Bacteroidaceae bacterium]